MSISRGVLLTPELRFLRPVLEADGVRWGAQWRVERGALVLKHDGRSLEINATDGTVTLKIDEKWILERREAVGSWVPEWRWWAVLAFYAATAPNAIVDDDLLLTTPFGVIHISALNKKQKFRARRKQRQLLNSTMTADLQSGALPSPDAVERALAEFPQADGLWLYFLLSYLNVSASEWGASWHEDGDTLRLTHPEYPHVDVCLCYTGPEIYSLVRDGRWEYIDFCYEYPDQGYADYLDEIARAMTREKGEIVRGKLVFRDGNEATWLRDNVRFYARKGGSSPDSNGFLPAARTGFSAGRHLGS